MTAKLPSKHPSLLNDVKKTGKFVGHEAYLAVGRNANARRQLDAIINMTPDPNYLPEYKEAVTEAHLLLKKI